MPLEPEELLQRAVDAGALDEQKGQAAVAVYARLLEMGAEFSFGDFLVERGLLARMAVDAFEADSGQTFTAIDTLGDYQLIELLGEGESGAVFKAVQSLINREVAVKVLNTEIAQDPVAVERFLREARAVAKLNHPNVVHGYSAGTEQGLHYFAMELLDGGSARDLMEAAGGRLSEMRALEITLQAAEGLKAAHACGILHRDIKPDNILLSSEGVAKLTDLGIAQIAHSASEGGTFWGSPAYVAPETIRGGDAGDPRCDIYSLGATLFEMLIGAPPFLDDDPEEILRMHLNDEPLDVKLLRPELNPRTATLIKLMLAKKPTERAHDADVVVRAIQKIIQELKQTAAVATGRTPARPHAPVRPFVPQKKRLLKPAKPALVRVPRPLPRPAAPKLPVAKKPLPTRPAMHQHPHPRPLPVRGRRQK